MTTRRRGAGVVAALALLLGALVLAGPVPSAGASGGVKVTVTSLTPAVATAGSTLDVAGTVTNSGDQVVRDVTVQVRISDARLNSRAELAAVVDGTIGSRRGEVVAQQPLADLAPGSSEPFDLQQALDDVASLTTFGVYGLSVEVLGTRGSDTGRVAISRSLLPWVPAAPDFSATGFSWVWPLVGVPVRLADGTFANDSLAAALAPGGRLDRLLATGGRLQDGAALTWAIDPDLVETVADMADGYDVVTADGTVPGGGSGLAQDWLAQLRSITAGADVLVLPYADPDLVAVERHGLPGDLARARADGLSTMARLLPAATTIEELAWPINGYLDRATLAGLRRTGVTAAVLDGRALPATIDLSYTPSGRAVVPTDAGRVAALLADPTLADLLARARPQSANPVLAAQRIVAETAMITSELPSQGTARTIVAMPPRRWDPPQQFLDQLETLASARWVAPVSLRALAASDPPQVDRGRLRYPASQRRAELPDTYLTALNALQESISNFAAVLTDRTQLVPGLESSRLRLESSWWRDRPSRSIRLDREKKYLAATRALVHVQPGSFTFGSKSGKMPVTLVNDLTQTVNVVLRLEPQTPRLRLGDVTVPPIGPQQKIQVNVPVTAVANGVVVVEATLHTPSGAAYGQSVPLRVNITEIGTVALVITVAAGVVLFLAAGIRVVRRVRAARRGHPDGPDGSGGPDDPDPAAEPDGPDAPGQDDRADVTA